MLEKPPTHTQAKAREKSTHAVLARPKKPSTLSDATHTSPSFSPQITYKSIPIAPTTAAANPASGTYLPAVFFEFVATGLAPVDVAGAVLDAAAELVGAAPAPALMVEESRLPQLLLHWEEPGFALLHLMKVYWHSRKGRVCWYWARLSGVLPFWQTQVKLRLIWWILLALSTRLRRTTRSVQWSIGLAGGC